MMAMKGILIGIGGILPGLSGGVLAVVFGYYDPLMRFLGDLRKHFWKNVRYFLPLGLGMGLGILAFSFFVSAAFGRYAVLFTSLFIGLVFGTFPALWREAGREGRQRSDWLCFIMATALILWLMLSGDREILQLKGNLWIWLLSGAAIGLGVIMPGLSPSNFLIYFGLYKQMSDGIKAVDLQVILPLGMGAVLVIFLLAKLVNYLLELYHGSFYHVIIGLVLGSGLGIVPTVIWPGLQAVNLARLQLSQPLGMGLSLLLFLVGVLTSYAFSRFEDAQASFTQIS